jgi:hypothetical protein
VIGAKYSDSAPSKKITVVDSTGGAVPGGGPRFAPKIEMISPGESEPEAKLPAFSIAVTDGGPVGLTNAP